MTGVSTSSRSPRVAQGGAVVFAGEELLAERKA
jgi:hypothetical protein